MRLILNNEKTPPHFSCPNVKYHICIPTLVSSHVKKAAGSFVLGVEFGLLDGFFSDSRLAAEIAQLGLLISFFRILIILREPPSHPCSRGHGFIKSLNL